MNDIYEKILEIFISDDELKSSWMQTPFLIGEKIAATNAYSLVAIPKFTNLYEPCDKAGSVYPLSHNCNIEIPLSELKEAIAKAPLIDSFEETEENCDACDGEGEVEYEFFYKSESYTIYNTCPLCNGQGNAQKSTNTDIKVIDYSKFIKIGNSLFHIKRFSELVKTAELLESETVNLKNQTIPNNPSLFAIKDVEVLIMPCASGEHNIYTSITF